MLHTLCRKYASQVLAAKRGFASQAQTGKEKYIGGPLKVGHFATLTKKFSQTDVNSFSGLSEDRNPLHLDAQYAKTTRFKSCIVHGFLTASLLSAVAGCLMPGEGTIYLNQELNFKKPVFPGNHLLFLLHFT